MKEEQRDKYYKAGLDLLNKRHDIEFLSKDLEELMYFDEDGRPKWIRDALITAFLT